MKDKIKQEKEVDDCSHIGIPKTTDMVQCPKCLSLFNLGFDHKCKLGWMWCSVCGLDLHKKGKEIIRNGRKYVTMPYKKSYNIMDKLICWQCAFKLVKAFKHDKDGN